jgi:hypothetical protein
MSDAGRPAATVCPGGVRGQQLHSGQFVDHRPLDASYTRNDGIANLVRRWTVTLISDIAGPIIEKAVVSVQGPQDDIPVKEGDPFPVIGKMPVVTGAGETIDEVDSLIKIPDHLPVRKGLRDTVGELLVALRTAQVGFRGWHGILPAVKTPARKFLERGLPPL